jgi:hypothetical protein
MYVIRVTVTAVLAVALSLAGGIAWADPDDGGGPPAWAAQGDPSGPGASERATLREECRVLEEDVREERRAVMDEWRAEHQALMEQAGELDADELVAGLEELRAGRQARMHELREELREQMQEILEPSEG